LQLKGKHVNSSANRGIHSVPARKRIKVTASQKLEMLDEPGEIFGGKKRGGLNGKGEKDDPPKRF